MGNIFVSSWFFLGMGCLGSVAIINLICQRASIGAIVEDHEAPFYSALSRTMGRQN